MDGQNSGAIAGKRMVCPVCKKEFGADILYCDVDGNRLAEAPVAQPAPIQTTASQAVPATQPAYKPSRRKRSPGRVFIGGLAYLLLVIILAAGLTLGIAGAVTSGQPIVFLVVIVALFLLALIMRKWFDRLRDWMNE